jgi:membrane-associated phospholipid phosphatase
MVGICALLRLRKVMPKTAWIMSAWLSLVFPATVMLRQHYLIDVFAGVFVGFAVYWAVMFVVERPKLVPSAGDDLVVAPSV